MLEQDHHEDGNNTLPRNALTYKQICRMSCLEEEIQKNIYTLYKEKCQTGKTTCQWRVVHHHEFSPYQGILQTTF
jgi:hypothetical protein